MTRLWSSNKAQHRVGVEQRAGACVRACVVVDYPLHNLRKQTDSIGRGLSLDEVITHDAELLPHHTSTDTHGDRGMSTQTVTHSQEFL